MLLTTSESRWDYLRRLSEVADEVLVSSYNIYTGMSKNGNLVKSSNTLNSRRFMDNVNRENTRILIGVPPSVFCRENCLDCQENRDGLVSRFSHHQRKWDKSQFGFARGLHLKLYLFRKGDKWKGFTGGANLSASQWEDLLIQIPDEGLNEAKDFFERLWAEKREPIEVLKNWSFD
tara:strand:+ start:901 stop:1428 length:528 start_codon:yes stop_codon:yes gene_type:complete